MEKPSAIPGHVIEAVLTFVNAGGMDELKRLVLTHRAELLSDEADQAMNGLIADYGGSAEDLAHLRHRRAILLRSREVGIDAAFHPTPEFQRKRETMLSFLNTRDTGKLLRFVREHRDLLLSDDVDRIIHDVAFDFRDDPRIQEFIRDRRKLLENCRHQGIEKAFSGQVLEIREDLAQAIMMFLSTGPPADVRGVLRENQSLLMSDEGEQALKFITEAATQGGDQRAGLMQTRLSLLRSCRASGIDAAFDLSSVDRIIEESLQRANHAPAPDPAIADRELDEALRAISNPQGAVAEEDLRALLERRTELASAIRARLRTGQMIHSPPADRTGIEQVIEATRVAQETGEWSKIIPIARAALQKVSRESGPEIWATLHESLATALSRTPHGERAENLDQAIEHHELARQVFKPGGPEPGWQMWAMNEHHLALALFQRVRGDRTENVEKAILIWQNLISTFGETDIRLEWRSSLGDALRERQVGNRARNIEEAIAILTDTVVRANRAGDSYNGGRARVALGLAYAGRIEGDPADNLEQAILLLERGIEEAGLENDLTSWANVQRSLANTYRQRKFSDPRENWKIAIGLLRAIEDRCPKDRFPEQWAETRLMLATLHAEDPDKRSFETALEVIRMMESALEVYSRHDFPDRWAKVHANISSMYAALFGASEGQSEYFEQSLKHINEAFHVYTREAAPSRWALLHRTLGKLNMRRAERSREEEREAFVQKSLEHFERALEAAKTLDDSDEILEDLKNLSILYFRRRDWRRALELYVEAMRCSDRLLVSAHTEAGQMMRAGESEWLYGPAAYCLFQLNDPQASLLCTEWGRTRILSQALAMRDLDIARLPEVDRESIARLRTQCRALESDARAERAGGATFASVAATLSHARKELVNVIARVQEAHPRFLRTRVTLDEIYDSTPDPGALVAPLITAEGSAVYIVLRNERRELEFLHLSIAWLNRDVIRFLLVGSPEKPGWVRQYRAWQGGSVSQSAWSVSMKAGLSSLWTFMMEGVSKVLGDRLPEGAAVAILPPGELSFFPFHAASPDGSGRGSLVDRFAVSYAPSVYGLLASQRRLSRRQAAPMKFVGVLNPTGDLPYADSELDGLNGVIPAESRTLFCGERARVSELRGCVGGATHLHFACHGVYDTEDIMKSGLRLAGSTMTMEDIMRPELQMNAARLVTLSACESGRIDIRYSADEFIGLPGAFLQGGACGVLSTLWPVADRATNLLIRQFYQAHLVDRLPPASALRRAQLWLRDATREQIADYYRSVGVNQESHGAYVDVILGGAPGERPYEAPFYWSAFQFTGA
jgi:tetratricopeptide (TPR) repeat protein